METTKKEKESVKMWRWNQPENGLSVEDCERIAEENLMLIHTYSKSSGFAVLFR